MTELKRMSLIPYLKRQYGLQSFIETGCYQGDGVQYAFDCGFRTVLSCDINEQYVAKCNDRFKHREREREINHAPSEYFVVLHGTSTECLTEHLQNVVTPSLIWLDAHFPEMYGGEGLDFPVIEEIEVIKQHHKEYQSSVIIVDDTRAIKSDDNERFTPGETICVEPVTTITIGQIWRLLRDTHRMTHMYEHEGYLVFTPL